MLPDCSLIQSRQRFSSATLTFLILPAENVRRLFPRYNKSDPVNLLSSERVKRNRIPISHKFVWRTLCSASLGKVIERSFLLNWKKLD